MGPASPLRRLLRGGLHEQERLLRAVLESAADGILVADLERMYYFNQRFVELWRIPPELLAPPDPERIRRHALDQLADPEAYAASDREIAQSTQELRDTLRLKDGRVYERYVRPFLREGRLAGHVLSFRDITGRLQAEQMLSESEERFARVFASCPLAVSISRLSDGLFIDCNPAFAELVGCSRDEVIGRTGAEMGLLLDSADRQRALELLQEQAAVRGFESKVRTKSGEIRDVESSFVAIELAGEPCFLTISEDVTERKRAEDALRESEERFAFAFRASPLAIAITRASDGRVMDANESFLELFGYTHDEVIGRTTLELGVYADPAQRAEVVDVVREHGVVRSFAIKGRTKSGEVRDISLSAAFVDLQGERCLLSIAEDITERRRAEEALLASEERFRRLFEDSPLGMGISTPDLRVTQVNAAFCSLTGYTAEERLGRPYTEIIHPDDVEENIRLAEASFRGELPFFQMEMRYIRKDGEIIWVRVSGVEVRDQAGSPMYGVAIVEDITKRVRMEETLQQAREELEEKAEREIQEKNPYGLTFREFTVLHLVAAGKADKEIASELGISVLTANKHVSNILSKMNATSRTEAGVRALREGLIE